MRLLISLFIIMAVVVGVGFWTNHMLEVSTRDLLKKIDAVSDNIQTKDWSGAGQRTAKLEETWKEKASWWPLVLDHQEMDNIEFSLARVKEYVSARDTSLSRGQISELREMVKHIPEKEAVNLKNIL